MSDEQVRREFENKFPIPPSIYWHGGEYIPVEFDACDALFERTDELDLMLKAYQAAHQSRQAEIDRLTAELAECKKDAERLDYLDSIKVRNGSVVQLPINAFMPIRESIDDAREIDAAMESKNDNT